MKFLAMSPEWQSKKIVRTLADLPEIAQSGELELEPDPAAEHCIPRAIMAKLNAFQ
jgi:hypothetical protein